MHFMRPLFMISIQDAIFLCIDASMICCTGDTLCAQGVRTYHPAVRCIVFVAIGQFSSLLFRTGATPIYVFRFGSVQLHETGYAESPERSSIPHLLFCLLCFFQFLFSS